MTIRQIGLTVIGGLMIASLVVFSINGLVSEIVTKIQDERDRKCAFWLQDAKTHQDTVAVAEKHEECVP